MTFTTDDWKLIVPAVITVSLFFAGQIAITWRDRNKEHNRLKDVREYFYVCLIHLQKGVEMQIVADGKLIKVFEAEIKSKNSQHHQHRRFIELSVNQILSISKNDTFKFLVLKKKKYKTERIKKYTPLYTHLELIEKTESIMDEASKEYANTHIKKTDEFAQYVNGIIEIITDTTKTYFENQQKDMPVFHRKLHDIYNNQYVPIEIKTVDAIRENFCLPLHEICLAHLDSPDSFSIIRLNQLAEVAFVEMLDAKKQMNRKIQDELAACNSSLQIIEGTIKTAFKDMRYDGKVFGYSKLELP